jgi:hypothetical protein
MLGLVVWTPSMEQVSLGELRLLDLHGNAVDLREHFGQYLLLIFLRHLA